MAGAIINDRRPDLDVVTAGTLTVDGQPISFRTREALKQIGLQAQGHRSKQIDQHHVDLLPVHLLQALIVFVYILVRESVV